jgi:hypothetical protein
MAIGKALSASERARLPEVRYDGKPLEWVKEYTYLGLPFHCTRGFGGFCNYSYSYSTAPEALARAPRLLERAFGGCVFL